MAFVFSEPRWQKDKPETNLIGPGTYDLQHPSSTLKLGIISPQKTPINRKTAKDSNPTNSDAMDLQIMLRSSIQDKKIKNQGKIIKSQSKMLQYHHDKENRPDITKILDKVDSKNTIPKKVRQHPRSSEHKFKRKTELMKVFRKRKQTPLLSQFDQIQVYKTTQRPKRVTTSQINKKRSKMHRSYNHLTNNITENPILAQDLFINTYKEKENFDRTDREEVSVRKIKTAGGMNRRNKGEMIEKDHYKMQDEGPTGIQDDSEGSVEYVDDSTPGPGTYNIYEQPKKQTQKVGKFGTTIKRFEQPRMKHSDLPLTISMPDFKRCSKAPQKIVAFGKSNNQIKNQQCERGQDNLFTDMKSIEKKSSMELLKGYYRPGFFLSKEERFKPQKEPEFFGEDFLAPEYLQQQNHANNGKPNSAFISQVQRVNNVYESYPNVNFQGQSYKTIQKKIQDKMAENEDIDRSPIPFMTDEQRFKQNKKLDWKQPGECVPKEKKKKQEPKSYTFLKADYREDIVKQKDNPAVGSYKLNPPWIKQTYNVKFLTFDTI